ncbi:MAG: tRNA (adenosine(37)-N6)-dimethylallyltransferase MiaA [Candidatus Omnitrophota bacterium]|nr:tRNA (adenosine(37)-N6)-dimethylallyltransferase MiaA [Candidatus Omnitrophota bacterium]
MPCDMVVFLVGPTGIGKTEVSVKLAKKIGGEIISCDSMQIYKDMNIITSAPRRALLKSVKHHLLGVVSPQKEWNVSAYRRLALKSVKEIFSRGRTPLFTGGTGLYLSSLVDGIFEERETLPGLRASLEALDGGILARRLAKVDPEASKKIHLHDKKRIVRALEVYESTGHPISALQKRRNGLADTHTVRIFCLSMDRNDLYARIDARVEKMFSLGLLKEAKSLLGRRLSRTARYAIGLRELKSYFKGEISLDSAKELIKRNSRRYAKRQLTWFRKDKRIIWVEAGRRDAPERIAGRIYSLLKDGD